MRIRAETSIILALAALACCGPAEASSLAPDGIAISTHRAGGGDHGFGVAPEVFGDLVRHDYSEQGRSPDGVFNAREKDDTQDKRTIRRVNVLTGEDELAGVAAQGIWQLSLVANTTKTSGRFTVTGALLDFSDPGRKLNERPCTTGATGGRSRCPTTRSSAKRATRAKTSGWPAGPAHVMGRESQMNATISTDKAKS